MDKGMKKTNNRLFTGPTSPTGSVSPSGSTSPNYPLFKPEDFKGKIYWPEILSAIVIGLFYSIVITFLIIFLFNL